MQVALTFEEIKQKTLVPKQVIGLTAALLTGAALTPMNLLSTQGIPEVSANLNDQVSNTVLEQDLQPAANLKIMEEKAGAGSFNCLTVSNIALIEAQKELTEMRDKVIAAALSWQGVSYRWGGLTREGVDCSGLVQKVFRELGIELPRSSYEQFRMGVGIPKANLEPGDLVFFNTNGAGASHVGIYLGDGQFISATKNCVEIQDLDHPYWANTYRGSRRVIN
ncbi:MAG TPA: NlpC/P60 family protein [Peptococcaceae bacterium]|nr:NlpC/P60 family protein [Peptococcaceae bacterium]